MADSFVEVSKNLKYRQKWISDYNFFKAVEYYEYGVEGDDELKKLDLFDLKTLQGSSRTDIGHLDDRHQQSRGQ
jgi:hypothetical protein